MFSTVVIFAATFSSPELAKLVEPSGCPNVCIVVFRHHPGIIKTKEEMEFRKCDEKGILKALNDAEIGHLYEGGLGRGFELSIHARDLGKWKAAVGRLIKNGSLKYYAGWGLDENGYGLVPVR